MPMLDYISLGYVVDIAFTTIVSDVIASIIIIDIVCDAIGYTSYY